MVPAIVRFQSQVLMIHYIIYTTGVVWAIVWAPALKLRSKVSGEKNTVDHSLPMSYVAYAPSVFPASVSPLGATRTTSSRSRDKASFCFRVDSCMHMGS